MSLLLYRTDDVGYNVGPADRPPCTCYEDRSRGRTTVAWWPRSLSDARALAIFPVTRTHVTSRLNCRDDDDDLPGVRRGCRMTERRETSAPACVCVCVCDADAFGSVWPPPARRVDGPSAVDVTRAVTARARSNAPRVFLMSRNPTTVSADESAAAAVRAVRGNGSPERRSSFVYA